MNIGTPTPTHKLIHLLRIMADSGGNLTRIRVKTIIEAADRLQKLSDALQSDGKENETE